MPRLLLLLLAAAGFALVATAGSAFANVGPYSGQGYDASSYQCTNGVPNTLDSNFSSFGILRVTGGRPFTSDSCRQALWDQALSQTASRVPSLYFNVAYSNAYSRQVSGACASATSSVYSGKYLGAYRIGCAESQYAFGQLSTNGTTPTAWWLDVEVGNSWSSSDKRLNEAAIQGAADKMKSLSGTPIGVYSSANSWNTITSGNGFAPVSATGSWIAGAGSDCTVNHSFSNGLTQWLLQSGTTSAGADADYAC